MINVEPCGAQFKCWKELSFITSSGKFSGLKSLKWSIFGD